MYPHHVFDLEPAGTFGMYPICYWWVSGRYFQPEPAMYSRCFRQFPGPLAPSDRTRRRKPQGCILVVKQMFGCFGTSSIALNVLHVVLDLHFRQFWPVD